MRNLTKIDAIHAQLDTSKRCLSLMCVHQTKKLNDLIKRFTQQYKNDILM